MKHVRKIMCSVAAGALLACLSPLSHAGLLDMASELVGGGQSSTLDASKGQSVEVGFSPDGDAEMLVMKVIRTAKHSIRLAGYSFTSPQIARALADAKRRGVDVAVVVDYRNNLEETRNPAPRQALNLLVNAGVPTRVISVYPIHHDKYIVADGLNVETGSFNYTLAAAKSNSENALVVWDDPKLAAAYIAHWQSRWNQATQYQSSY
jgi:phosphatidylserine/phosphatidylglycerophosphate/cardiolipin synthase-like enzyme